MITLKCRTCDHCQQQFTIKCHCQTPPEELQANRAKTLEKLAQYKAAMAEAKEKFPDLNLDNLVCSKCEYAGLHACIGYVPKPLTPEQEKELRKAFERVAKEEGREPKSLPKISVEKSKAISERGRKAILERYGE